MTLEITSALRAIIELIDDSVSDLVKQMKITQSDITELMLLKLLEFDVAKGSLVRNQASTRLLNQLEKEINQQFETPKYKKSISGYLESIYDIEQKNIDFQSDFNDLEVAVSRLSPARKLVYDQTQHYLKGAGLNQNYIQPAKFLMMQNVAQGSSLKNAKRLIQKWDQGKISPSETFGRNTPNLQRYANQLTYDTNYQYNGTINKIIADEYNLTHFIYVGGLIQDSRPLCIHLVERDEPIPFDEIDALIKEYPKGTIAGTNKDNFIIYRGGYNCQHLAVAVSEDKF